MAGIDAPRHRVLKKDSPIELVLLLRELRDAKAESCRLCKLVAEADLSPIRRKRLGKKWKEAAEYRELLQRRAEELGAI